MQTIEIFKRYKYRPWTFGWGLFVATIYILWILYLIYGFLEGKKGNPKYLPIYNLFRYPSWQHFKDFLASIANDPVTEAALIILVAILPVPGLPYYVYERLEFVLAKIGLFQLFVTAILGNPNYTSTSKNETLLEQIISYALLIIVIGVIIGSFVYSRYYV